MMVWVSKKEKMPPEGRRILVFSPVYSEGDPMRFRILDGQFFRISPGATHWAILESPGENTPI
jgi:hypothetical protein